MWKAITRAARSSWFAPKQWRSEPTQTTDTEDQSSKAVSTHCNLFTRNINSAILKDSFGNGHDSSNKRKKSSYRNEYDFSRINPFLDVISWLGAPIVLIVNLKLKLYNYHHNLCYQYEDQDCKNYSYLCMRHGLSANLAKLYSHAFSMPYTRKAVLPDTSTTRNDILKPTKITSDEEKPEKSEHSSTDKGYEEMKMASAKYIGHIENMIGLQLLSKDPAHAFHHFKASGDLGCSKGNFNLGLCYELGKGTKRDLSKAMHYYQLAASDGHGFAMYNLGIYYIDGLGGQEADDSMGLQLIEKAAELGIPEAQNFMGINCLENEKWGEAFKYFENSAQHNFADSQYYLGLCYENGWGVNINYSEATKHFSSAATNGQLDAKIRLQNYPDKDQDASNNCKENKGQQNSIASLHPSSSSPELSRMGSPTQPHPLTNSDISSYFNMDLHNIWQKVDYRRNHWLGSDAVFHVEEELPHWSSTPSLLTVT